MDVRIITTGKPDSWPVFLASFHYMNELRDIGRRFYAYEPGFLHEKVTLIDDKYSTVGIPSFDSCSLRLNFEVTALIADRAFAAEMARLFGDGFAHAVELSPAELDRCRSSGGWPSRCPAWQHRCCSASGKPLTRSPPALLMFCEIRLQSTSSHLYAQPSPSES